MNAPHDANVDDCLRGHVAVITGGNAGIGLGIAQGLARAGASVAILARRADANECAYRELAALGAPVLVRQCDVTSETDVRAGFDAAMDQFGSVDSAFANAGIIGRSNFLDLTLDEWRRVTSVNLDGVFITFREAARHMIDTGRAGSLVAVSSTSAFFGAPRMPHYAAAKSGVLGLVRSAAVELASYGIRVNALVPGWTDTDMLSSGKAHQPFFDATVGRTPMRRWGTADDFAAPAVFLADPRHSFHTGDTLVVDGGYSVF